MGILLTVVVLAVVSSPWWPEPLPEYLVVVLGGLALVATWLTLRRTRNMRRCAACHGLWHYDDWIATVSLAPRCPVCGHTSGHRVQRDGPNRCRCADCLMVRAGLRVLKPTIREHRESGDPYPAMYQQCRACMEDSPLEEWTGRVPSCPNCGHTHGTAIVRMRHDGPCECAPCLIRRLLQEEGHAKTNT